MFAGMSTPQEEPGNPEHPEPYPRLPGYAGPEYSGYEIHDASRPRARPQGTNGFAVAALVSGILGCSLVLIVLAGVFGCVALSQIKKTGQAGRGLAIAGLVAAGVWVAAVAALVVFTGALDHLGYGVRLNPRSR